MYVEYKSGEKHGASNADISETTDSFSDCGMLLTREDVVIDIDHLPKESIKALLSEFGIHTQTVWTDRGAHLWFKKPAWFTKRKDGVCRLGFKIEQHTSASRPNGMTIKRNGVERVIENSGERAFLPALFKIDSKGNYYDLTGKDEGEGRNESLFNHRMTLQRNNAPDIEKICSFINRYVFAVPLPDEEFATLMRDIETNEGSGNRQAQIANQIINECGAVSYYGCIWWKDSITSCRYLHDEGNERLIRRVYQTCEGEKTAFVDEIIKQIRYRAPIIPEETAFPIRFKNGILQNGRFIPCKDYQEFTPYYIDVVYKPDAEPVPIVDEYIRNLTDNDPDYINLLAEVIGFVMITDQGQVRSLGKFFMFRGNGANGKGTLLQIMKRIYHGDNCTFLSIKQLTDDRYKSTMIGKLANLGDDIEAAAITHDQLKILKNISTADSVSTRFLYHESRNATFTTKLYFTTNSDIKSFEKGYAFKRRIEWLPMFNKILKPDPRFISKLTTKEALEYWIRLIVEGYKRLYVNECWTSCKVVKDYNDQYHEANNPCYMFAKELNPLTDIVGKTVTEMKESFEAWDAEDGKWSSKLFKEAVWDLYKIGIGSSRVSGSVKKVFLRQEDTEQVLQH